VKTLLALIKPQFEAGRRDVGKKGIVRNPLVHSRVLEDVIRGVQQTGFNPRGLVRCSTKGQKGNVEFFGLFVRERPTEDGDAVRAWIEEAVNHEKSE
jgi:23S rRNA (cytidine1920-2'-O)/16S rRNA (cytidine1409-2'-O)-methyltransferase